MAEENVITEAIHTLNRSYKTIREQIEQMDDEQLLELYERAKDVANLSWFIRCVVLGTARGHARHGDGVVLALAKEFGIGRRAAELDMRVFDIFIKDNPDFEPELPALFYQLACTAENPFEALARALELRAEIPSFPASSFARELRGRPIREPAPTGFYVLVKAGRSREMVEEEARLDGHGAMGLYGRVEIISVGGELYAEVK